MRQLLLTALSLLVLAAQSAPVARAQAPASPTIESILREAPTESRTALAPGSQAHQALASMLKTGKLNAEHLGKIVKNPFLSSRIAGVLPNLKTIEAVPGADRLLKQLVKATNENRAVGFSFEAQVAARFGSQLKEISATVNGHEVDAVLKNGTLVEMKSLPADQAVSKAMIEKATAQLALRGVQGQKLMLVTNRPLSKSLTQIVKSGLGARVEIKSAKALVSVARRHFSGAKNRAAIGKIKSSRNASRLRSARSSKSRPKQGIAKSPRARAR